MSIELIIGAGFIALLISIYIKHREKPVDMNHTAPNVHNVQMKGKVGPATAADKPATKAAPKTKAAAAPKKKVVKKKTTKKKTTKKTTKK